MENGQKFWQLSLSASPKFVNKAQKIFLTQPFSLGKISFLFCLIHEMNEIFHSA
jgi:hypothetical protein